MRIKYNAKRKVTNFTAEYEYMLNLPKYIIELIKDWKNNDTTMAESSTLEEYIASKFNSSNSSLHQIFLKTFNKFPEILSFDKIENSSEINEILTNGFVKNTDSISYEVDSIQPLTDDLVLKIMDTKIALEHVKEMVLTLENILTTKIKDSFDLVINSTEEGATIEKEEIVTFDVSKDGYMYSGTKVNMDVVDMGNIYRENNVKVNAAATISEFQDNFSLWTYTEYEKFSKWFRVGSKKQDMRILIKENNIEEMQVFNVHKIPMFSKKSITPSDFKKGTNIYDDVLKGYKSGEYRINRMMLNEFAKNEQDIAQDIVDDPNSVKFLKDKVILASLLLNNGVSKINPTINSTLLKEVLVKSSNISLPIMYGKLSDEAKNNMMDFKLINKVRNIDLSLLTEEQITFFNDEEARKLAMKDEYNKLMGEIAVSGAREKLGTLSKKEKQQLGITGKSFKKWLDSNIGHNKGGAKDITPQVLDEVRNIRKKVEKVINYISKNSNK